jgi:hypothetical protein
LQLHWNSFESRWASSTAAVAAVQQQEPVSLQLQEPARSSPVAVRNFTGTSKQHSAQAAAATAGATFLSASISSSSSANLLPDKVVCIDDQQNACLVNVLQLHVTTLR